MFFAKQGGNLNFEKNVEFLEFLGFTLCFRTFQAKKIFFEFFFQPTDSANKLREFVIFDYQS